MTTDLSCKLDASSRKILFEIFYRNTYFKCRRWLSKAFLTPATFKNAFEGDTANTPGLCELKEKILIKRQRAKPKSNYIFGE